MTADPGSGTPMSERMQALLSRAVEDQLTEQRQVAGVLGEVRGHLARLEAQLDELRAAPSGGSEDLERSVSAVSGEVREAVRLLGERLDMVTGMVHQRGQDLAEQRTVIDQLGPRVDAVDTALRELRSAFAGIAARVADLPARADLDAVVQRAGEPAAGLPERIGRIEGWLEELHDGLFGVDGLQTRVTALAVEPAEEVDVAATVHAAVAGSEHRLAVQVDSAVAGAVADSEQRLKAHIDEAVLALAEALLRRRAMRPATPSSAPDLVAADLAPPMHLDLDAAHEAEEDEEYDADEDLAEYAEEGEGEYVDEGDDGEELEPAAVHAALREHGAAFAAGGLGGPDDDDPRKRRPWWRPGD